MSDTHDQAPDAAADFSPMDAGLWTGPETGRRIGLSVRTSQRADAQGFRRTVLHVRGVGVLELHPADALALSAWLYAAALEGLDGPAEPGALTRAQSTGGRLQ